MIVTLLETGGSCLSALDYSERKVAECEATVCSVHNIPSYTPKDIYRTILSYERNPRVASQTRNFKFHIAVNPGEEDGMDRLCCLRFIDDLMRSLGYGEQPYVVYRHNDIDREHYHVVSVKVDADGRSLWRDNDAVFLLEACRALESKYGFRLGGTSMRDALIEPLDPMRRLDSRAGHLYDQFRTHFAEACLYDVRSEEDFAAVLESRSVKYRTHLTPAGRVNVILQGLDPLGKTCTRPCYLSSRLDVDAYPMVMDAVSRGCSKDGDRYSDEVDNLCRCAMDATPTAAHFRKYMDECGVYVCLERDGASLGRLMGVRLVDRASTRVLHGDDLCAQTLERLLEMETGPAPAWKRSSIREAQLLTGCTLVDEKERRRIERELRLRSERLGREQGDKEKENNRTKTIRR